MRSIRLAIAFISFALPLSLLFTNCEGFHQSLPAQNTNTSENQIAPATTPIRAQAPPAFASGKLDINWDATLNLAEATGNEVLAQKSRLGMKAVDPVLPAGTPLILNIRNFCASLERSSLYSWIDNSQRFENLEEQSYSLNLPKDIKLAELEALIESDPCVIGISNDAPVSAESVNDPLYSSQRNLLSIGHQNLQAVSENPRWGSQSSVVVAVIDSGTDFSHPELRNRLWQDGSGNYGYDYFNGDSYPADDYGHGTAVAGLIAAEANNAIGVSGVLGNSAKIMTLKTLNSLGDGYISSIVSAIDYARANGAHIINISISGLGSNESLNAALSRAVSSNIFVVVAAGNQGFEITPGNPVIPAIYGAGLNGVITVGSVDSSTLSKRSSFSNFSSFYVEMAAPGHEGVQILLRGGGYTTGSGTSYSAPVVSGAAAAAISFFRTNQISYTAGSIESLLKVNGTRHSSLSSFVNVGLVLNLNQLAAYLRTAYVGAQSGGFDEF